MSFQRKPKLSPKKKYLQIALNSTLAEASAIIRLLPKNDRIILEAGTPLIKRYGTSVITSLKKMYGGLGYSYTALSKSLSWQRSNSIFNIIDWGITRPAPTDTEKTSGPYVVADMKMMDRGDTEVEIAADAGADAVVALGASPIESLNAFISACEKHDVDSMVDMMNVEFPLGILRQLKRPPDVVILHRGVDEERFNKEKQIPFHEIQRIKSAFNIMIAIAGGDTVREAQKAIFNDADIVVVWKSFYQKSQATAELAKEFLKEVQ